MKNLLWWVHGSERLPESREGVEPFRAPERETRLERVGLPSLAVLGLLCHLLIFWLLSFPYTYFYDPMYQTPGSFYDDGITTITTGWQAMGFILILPVFPYLACLLSMLWKSARRKKWLETSLYLNGLVNLGGFLLMYEALQVSQWADLYTTSWRDAAYGIHLAILLLAVICSSASSVLLGSLLRQSRKLRCGQSLRIENKSTPDQVVWYDRYQFGALLGSGGFSAVYRARDRQEGGRDVAIKRISLQGLNAAETIEATTTFHREVSMLSALIHPQVPRLYDHFNDQDHWYLVLEYIEGQTLEAFLTTHETSGQPLQLAEILTMVLQLCTVLDYLHSRQPPIIFRDLKPSNILRTFGGKLYLIDFGIARRYQPGQPRDTQRLGSPGYAAPEQYGRAQTTPQADIYSLGALLHFLLSGQDPANSPLGLTPLRLHSQQGLAELELLVVQMLSPNPTERPASVRAVAKTLDRIKQRAGAGRIWFPPFPQASPLSDGPQLQMQVPHPAGSVRISSLSPNPQRGLLTRRSVLIGLGALTVAGAGGDIWWSNARRRGTFPISIPTPSTPLSTSVPFSVYSGHTAQVNAVAWSPAGKRIASASSDNTVQIWDATTGRNMVTYRGHATAVNTVAWSPNGQRIASASDDTTVQLWFADTGENSLIYRGHAAAVNTVAWSPDGQRIASGAGNPVDSSEDTTVQVWNANDGGNVLTYQGHAAAVNAVAWSPDGQRIASAPDGRRVTSAPNNTTVQVWNATTGETTLTYRGHASIVPGLAWSPDGQHIASASNDHTVQVWNATTGETTLTYRGHVNTANAVAWSPDGQRIVSVGNDVINQMQVWNATDGEEFLAYQYPPTRGVIWGVEAVAWSPDGQLIASASNNNAVQVWHAP